MRLGIHQPNFLPWMGYFYKMSKCDTFVLLDHVQFSKSSPTRRVKIHKAYGSTDETYITVPLQRHSDFASIDSLQLLDDDKWLKKISAQVHTSYHKAPFYHQVTPLMDTFFSTKPETLSFSDFTSKLILHIASILEIQPRVLRSSELKIKKHSDDTNLAISKMLGAETYISGMGAKKYQDEQRFEAQGIKLEYSDYIDLFRTLKLPEDFLDRSVICILANYDLETIREMMNF